MPKPYISAIVCTHNRCRELGDAIVSLINQDIDKDEYEIIVVNNASRDDTKNMVYSYINMQKCKIKYAEEENIGLSFARNAGIKAAEGEIVAFIDDDAIADEKWLSHLLKVFKECNADCVGGKVELIGYTDKPEWLPQEIEYFLTKIDFGNERILLKHESYPSGTNISFKKYVFDKVGPFDIHLGRRGDLLLSREESDICHRIQRYGGLIYYSPDAIVRHKLHRHRLTKKWFRKRIYWEGRSYAILDFDNLGLIYALKGLFRNIQSMLRYSILSLIYILKKDKKKFFLCECVLWKNLGFIVQVLAIKINTITAKRIKLNM